MALAVTDSPQAQAGSRRLTCEIRLDAVSKTYPAGQHGLRTVLSGIDLEIAAGEFVVVLGETGCGKSTLLRLILGEEHPSTGTIRVSGRPVRSTPGAGMSPSVTLYFRTLQRLRM